jgi:hypothetical protein
LTIFVRGEANGGRKLGEEKLWNRRISARCIREGTLTKRKLNFPHLQYIEIQMGSVAKSYMRKGFLIYEEMRKYLTIYGEAVNHI